MSTHLAGLLAFILISFGLVVEALAFFILGFNTINSIVLSILVVGGVSVHGWWSASRKTKLMRKTIEEIFNEEKDRSR